MAEAKKAKETTAYVPTRNALTAVGDLVHGEVVYLHDAPEVTNLVDAGYLVTQKDYLEQTSPAVVQQMEREQGVSAGESGSTAAQ